MTENELKRLKDLPVPAPAEGTREAAVAAALAAFERVATSQSVSPQGKGVPPRLRNTSSISEGIHKMRFRRPVAIAASIVVLALAAVPFAMHLLSPPHDGVAYMVPPPRDWLGREVRQERVAQEQRRDKVAALPNPAPSQPSAPSAVAPPVPPPLTPSRAPVATSGATPAKMVEACPPGRLCTLDQIAEQQRRRQDKAVGFEVGKDFAGLGGDVVFRQTTRLEPPKDAPAATAPPVSEGHRETKTVTLDPNRNDQSATSVAAPPPPPAVTASARGAAGSTPEEKQIPCPPGRICTLVQPKPAKQKAIDALKEKAPDKVADLPVRGFTSGGFGPREQETAVQETAVRFGASSRFPAQLEAGERSRLSSEAQPQPTQEGRDRFAGAVANPVKSVASEPVSTFSIDVDSASYAFVRRSLNAARLPPKEAVRVEEMINYFPYDYPLPADRSAPFRPTVTVLPSPWNPANKLVHIAIKGYDLPKAERPRTNLVLLVDTSGSMAPEDRLPLLKNAFRMLIDTLRPEDSVGIVTYAGGTHAALEPTKVADKRKILDVIERLRAGGSTAGGAGIQEAYRMAEGAFDKTAVNRVILATDGDFNVGITSVDELKSFIERKRETGIYLSVLGVGRGNYNDALMQALAQNGNGAAAYIDTLNEARKVLVDEVSSTLFPIAKDVKIQIEFNPAVVAEYRLIGYETRLLKRVDFNNDKIDAGDIGSGHTVTAIYEVTPVGSPRFVEDLRYRQPVAAATDVPRDGRSEYGFLRINYKLPAETVSRRIELPVTQALEKAAIDQAAADVRFSIAVAAFGQLLRGEPYLKGFGYDEVIALAAAARGEDLFGYRAEFLNLVRLAKTAGP
jgi:Ca-activated chloride channel family protein